VNQAAGAVEGCVIARYLVLGTKLVTRAVAQRRAAGRDGGATEVRPSAGWPEEGGQVRVCRGAAYSGLCSARVAGVFPTLLSSAQRRAAQRCGRWRGATGRRPMGAAKVVGAAADQPGSSRRTGRCVVRGCRGEGACDGSGWRIGEPSGVGGVYAVRHAVPIMTRRRPCCRLARVVGIGFATHAVLGSAGRRQAVGLLLRGCCCCCATKSEQAGLQASYLARILQSAPCSALLLAGWLAGRCRRC